MTSEMQAYLDASQAELKQLIRDLCAIPAPSHREQARAAFCKAWFERAGGKNVTIDEALNVLCPIGVTAENPVDVFMAHTDTVFPDAEPLPFRETAERFYCPGVVDDTANLAVMMICARFFLRGDSTGGNGVVFAANSCEEGLGNLKGCRAICDTYGKRIRKVISFDGNRLPNLVVRAVGSHRYRVIVRTEGGHSFADFGRRNAIERLSALIQALYRVPVPERAGTRTTYNVGLIGGGTSVNTIAQEASMLYEYRSDDRVCLERMKEAFERIVRMHRTEETQIDVELVGERPCGGDVDLAAMEALTVTCSDAIRKTLGVEPVLASGSTDANIPLSRGIPSVVLTAAAGEGCHTREESLALSSLRNGCRLCMDIIARSFDE